MQGVCAEVEGEVQDSHDANVRWKAVKWRQPLAICSAGFAFLGQYLLSNAKGSTNEAIFFYIIAVAASLPLAWSQTGVQHSKVDGPNRSGVVLTAALAGSPTRIALLLLAFGFCFTALRLIQAKTGQESYLDAALFWGIGAITFAATFSTGRPPHLLNLVKTHRGEIALLLALSIGGGIVRLIGLGSLPATVSGDEGRIGSLALSAVSGEVNNPFGTLFGHSTLYLMAMGLPMQILGPSPVSLRLLSAGLGILTISATYLLARRLFGPAVAGIAAALVAFSHFHIHFSRISVNGGIIDAFFVPLALFFLIRSLDDGKPMDFVLTGMTIGLQLYFYQGGRLMVIVLGAVLVAMAVIDHERMISNWRNLLVLVGAFLVVGAPMIFWAMNRPGEFLARANQVGIFQTGWLVQEAAKTGKPEILIIWDQFFKAMMAFISYPATGFYEARLPMFDMFTSIPFVLGLAYSCARTLDRRFLMLNALFFMAVAFGQVALVVPEQGAYRILLVLPIAMIMAAVALVSAVSAGFALSIRGKVVPVAIIALFVVVSATANLNYYFRDWAGAGTFSDPATRWASTMGRYLSGLDRHYKAYLFGVPGFTYGIHPSVDFLSGKMAVTNISETLTGEPRFVDRSGSAVFIFVPQREQELRILEQYLTGGVRKELWDLDNLRSGKPVLIAYEVSCVEEVQGAR